MHKNNGTKSVAHSAHSAHSVLSALAALVAALAVLVVAPSTASAGTFELSGGFNFSRSTYPDGSFQWSRKWGASVGYHFSERSEIEFSMEDVVNRTSIAGIEDTTFHDQIYGVNWVQSLMDKNFPIQPYFKVGIGQLNREASGTYAIGASPPSILDEVTGILGVGMRIYLTRSIGLRGEFTTYLSGGNINTWRDNIAFTAGASFYF